MLGTDFGIGLLVEFDYLSDVSGKNIFTNAICLERQANGVFFDRLLHDCV